MTDVAWARGLEGVIAGDSTICRIDGEEGRLYYRGYAIEDLAAHSDFEEVCYLLLNDRLPNAPELEEFRARLRAARPLHPKVLEAIRNFPPDGKPMELLQSVMAYLSGYVSHKIEHSAFCNCRQTLHQVAQLATVTAAHLRFRQGLDYVAPRPDLSHGANFLYMLRGRLPDPEEGDIMDACLVLHAEHGFNASTFTARVVASTLSTCYSSISAAIGALYGSLHGGANERVVAMIEEIGTAANAETWLQSALDEHLKIMGMGHRVYKAKDPRAVIMERYLERLAARKGDRRHLDILKKIEALATKEFEARGKKIYPNVDFFSGSVYDLLGIPPSLYTPIFAVARIPGWLAHVLEQREHDNRIFRPKSLYSGPAPRPWVPVAER
jgi:citrate synthase